MNYEIGQHAGYVSRPAPVPPERDERRRWHVVQVRPQTPSGEDRQCEIGREIGKNGMLAYMPLECTRVRVRNKFRDVYRAMMPGYLFAKFDPDGHLWPAIMSIEGVVRMPMCEGRPIPVAEADMSRIRHLEGEALDYRRRRLPGLRKGVFVRIIEPYCWSGLFGYIAKTDRKERTLVVEIDIFGRKTPVTLEPENVEIV